MNLAGGICAMLYYVHEDGLKGAAGYPLNAKVEASAAEKVIGEPINRLAVGLAVKILNAEYRRGTKNARKTGLSPRT